MYIRTVPHTTKYTKIDCSFLKVTHMKFIFNEVQGECIHYPSSPGYDKSARQGLPETNAGLVYWVP